MWLINLSCDRAYKQKAAGDVRQDRPVQNSVWEGFCFQLSACLAQRKITVFQRAAIEMAFTVVVMAASLLCFCGTSVAETSDTNAMSMQLRGTDSRAVGTETLQMSIASERQQKEGKETHDVKIDLNRIVTSTGPRFAGVTIDSSIFRRVWQRVDVTSQLLLSLARGLAPSYVRVGGSAADFFIFNTTAEPAYEGDDMAVDYQDNAYEDLGKPLVKNYTVTKDDWKRLQYFVSEAGWDLIFDFNEFQRRGDLWDPDNARELLAFSQGQNYSIPCFQLGNEPNSYSHNFNFSIPGSRLASDMHQLRELLSNFPAYRNSCILGPDVTKVTETSSRKYLEEFLQMGGQNVVAAVTLHHYYFNVKDHGASVNDFLNATILNSLKRELSIGLSIAQSLAPKLPVWFSETSSVSGGGLPGVSNGYAAGFMWLDKLGLSALSGIQTVLRQSFYKGEYALIADDFTPYPDYFLTVLYKRLVQGPVFNVTTWTDSVRMYASCANPASYQKGALTVYVLNVRGISTTLDFPQFASQLYELYLLTPGDGSGMKSAFVALNGQKLIMVDKQLPPLPPLLFSGQITLPAYSFGFIVIPHANVEFCWLCWERRIQKKGIPTSTQCENCSRFFCM